MYYLFRLCFKWFVHVMKVIQLSIYTHFVIPCTQEQNEVAEWSTIFRTDPLYETILFM